MTFKRSLLASVITISSLSSPILSAADYKVTITNITHEQIFTPVLLASHVEGLGVFQLGSPAIPELESLAESGDVSPGKALLNSLGNRVADVQDSGAVLPAGKSVTMTLTADENTGYFMMAAMLIPSNDAFVAINGKALPKAGQSLTYYAAAYDAGTENNDELCENIPGPPNVCAGEGVSSGSAEGFVHMHPGIHGVGDLSAASYDWRGSVARITVDAL